MKIAVCDNDKMICDDIVHLIHRENSDIIVKIFNSGKDLLNSIEDFEIYFLDIKGINGIFIANILRKRQIYQNKPKSIIIFITGYREYMESAFDVNAFHYLIKPVNPIKFSEIFKNACNEAIAIENNINSYIIIKVEDKKQKLFLNDIIFVESNNKKVVFHAYNQIYETYGKMDDFEKILGSSFYRCHRCYIVNMSKIIAYNSESIKLENNEIIFIAHKKYRDFIQNYMKYAKKGGIVNV